MAFFDQLSFNPQGYGGQGGGLLELLKQFQTQQQYQPAPQSNDLQGPSGHIKVGDYNMPQFGPRELYQPQQAQLPPNAQPTQGQMPQQQMPAAQEPNRLMTGLQGFLGNLHNGPIGALAGGLGGAITGQRTDPGGIAQAQANQTAQALVSKGFDPNLALTIAKNPDLLKVVLPQVLGIGGQTDDIKEYQFARKEEPNLTFQQYMARKRATTGEYGLTPIWGTGPDGKPAYIQPGKSGDARLAKLPEGFEIARDPIKVEGPTGTTILDPQTRQVVQFIPKDVRGAAVAEERGKIEGQAQGAIPAAKLSMERSIAKIDEFLNDKGFNEVFGVLDQFRPNFTMSDDGRRALTRFNQMEGTAFLEGRSMLKGGGAITDFESKKAEAAFSRLSRSLSESDARDALKDFRDAVKAGFEKLEASARGGSVQGAAPTTATPQRIRLNADGTIAQ